MSLIGEDVVVTLVLVMLGLCYSLNVILSISIYAMILVSLPSFGIA